MSEFPEKSKRIICWDARDKYWECLDTHAPNYNINNSSDKLPKECQQLRKLFEKNCPTTWVKHFDRKRTYDLFKKKMEQGYEPLDYDKK